MGKKPATLRQAQAAAKPKPSNAEMVATLRSFRSGKLFIGDMDLVDALLAEHDRLKAEVVAALKLLNQHLSGRTYTDLDDALRNLLQAHASERDNARAAEEALRIYESAAEDAREAAENDLTDEMDASEPNPPIGTAKDIEHFLGREAL